MTTLDPRCAADRATALVQAFHRDRPVTPEAAVAAMGALARRRTTGGVLRPRLEEVTGQLRSLLAGVAAIAIDGAVPVEELGTWARRLDQAPSLGRPIGAGRVVGAAWFAAVATIADPQERAAAYQRAWQVGHHQVEHVAGDLTSRCVALTSALLGGAAGVRPGFAGPGLVEFAGTGALGRDGDVHLDWEGLAAGDPLGLFDESYSFVLMVRPAEEGGDLRVWGIDADPAGGGVDEPGPGALVGYRPGTLVAFPARDLHQVTAMRGDRSRITATWHARRTEPGAEVEWEIWL